MNVIFALIFGVPHHRGVTFDPAPLIEPLLSRRGLEQVAKLTADAMIPSCILEGIVLADS
jgi:hypothetical protein